MSIGHEQALQVLDLLLQLMAPIGVTDEHTMVLEVLELYMRVDIGAGLDGFVLGLKVLMFDELQAMAIIY